MCGLRLAHYGRPMEHGRPLYFCPVVSFFLLSSFFPRLISVTADWVSTIHTSTHGVALVRIQNAGLKCAARSSREMQDAKNRCLGTIAQLCWAISSQLRHVSIIGKKLVKQQYLPHISPQYGELRPTSGRDRLVSLGHSR